MTATASRLLVGLGSEGRGDDGVGLQVVRDLRGRLPPDVDLVECRGDPLALLDSWEGRSLAVIVDAVRSGGSPGSVIELRSAERLPASSPVTSTHGVSLAEALALGGAVGRMPRAWRLVGVEVADLTSGHPLSAPVRAALPAAEAAVLRALDAGPVEVPHA